MKPRNAVTITAVAAQALLVACGGSDVTGPGDPGAGDAGGDPGGDSIPTAPSFAQDVNAIFTAAGCASGSCHGGGAGGLTLNSSASANYAAIVGVTSGCNGLLLVAPGDPTNSFLLMKVEGRQPCGSRMPLGGANITNAQITTIRNWISTGAPEN